MGSTYNTAYKPWKMELRNYIVETPNGASHNIESHFAFNNGAEGLVFRRYMKGDDRSTVVAAFAHGAWNSYKEIVEGV